MNPYSFFKATRDVPENAQSLSEIPEFNDLSNTTRSHAKTVNGFPFDIAKSALQKYVRRGERYKAMYWAAEMDLYRWVPGSKPLVTNFYNRIRITVMEDIGLINPMMIFYADTILSKWRAQKTPVFSHKLIELVCSMSMSKHNRFYSHISSTACINPPKANIPINPIELDEIPKIQEAANALIYALENNDILACHWVNIIFSVKTTNKRYNRGSRPGYLVFHILRRFLTSDFEIKLLQLCERWYKTMQMREQKLCVLHAMYAYIFRDVIKIYPIKPPSFEYIRAYDCPLMNLKLPLDDYVVDKHTKLGRKNQRDQVIFGVEGSRVVYDNFEDLFGEDLREYILSAKKYYTQRCIKLGIFPSEKNEYTLKARAQLTCSNAKADSYYANDRLGNRVVVKGPYLSEKLANVTFNMQSVLKLFTGVNTFTANVRLLKVDMFESVPLGSRTRFKIGDPGYFVVMNDLFNQDEYKTICKSSKLWHEEQVVDYSLFHGGKYDFGVISNMTNEGQFSCLLQAAARYIFEIGDFAIRNFLRIDNTVYNLDTEGFFVGQKMKIKVTEKKLLVKHTKSSKYYKYLNNWMNDTRWDLVKTVVEDIERVQNNIKKLIDNSEKNLLGF
jgi:hypothetical protein